MEILILQDDTGKVWNDFAVVVEDVEQWGTNYCRKRAEKSLYSKFAEYWFSRRFPMMSDGFADEVGKTLTLNGWKVLTINTEAKP